MDQATLIAAFKAGEEAHAQGRAFTARLTIKAGKQRDFWEAGWVKADKAAIALYNSPEAVAQRAADREASRAQARKNRMIAETSLINAMFAGKDTPEERIRIALNSFIGIETTYK